MDFSLPSSIEGIQADVAHLASEEAQVDAPHSCLPECFMAADLLTPNSHAATLAPGSSAAALVPVHGSTPVLVLGSPVAAPVQPCAPAGQKLI